MAKVEIDAYLNRLGYHGPRAPTLETLHHLHRTHLLVVPFENLDISRGTAIVLDERQLFDKIVGRRRGGFCYELNGLFAALLRGLGYDVTMLSARVRQEGGFGPEFDHLTLRVEGGQLAGPHLADVGFGECFREPLPLADGAERVDGALAYRLKRSGAAWQLHERDAAGDWQAAYAFTLEPRQLFDFEAMCHYHQTSPDSHFTQGRVCSLATPDGRITLRDQRLIVTRGGQREERPIESEAAFGATLRDVFGIEV
jgi:N-hydroxyarylamine O-acetyltransferase